MLARELRAINLMDALLAIITVQNAIVSYKNAAADGGILAMTASSSALLLVLIIAISIWNNASGLRELKLIRDESR